MQQTLPQHFRYPSQPFPVRDRRAKAGQAFSIPGGGGELLPIVSLAEIGKSLNFSWIAATKTVGSQFRAHVPVRITGVRLWAKFTGTRTLRCKLWTSVGQALLTTVDKVVVGTGQIEDVLFAASVDLSPNTLETGTYSVTVWDTSGVPTVPDAGVLGQEYVITSLQVMSHKGVLLQDIAESATDSYPLTSRGGVGGGSCFCVDPILVEI